MNGNNIESRVDHVRNSCKRSIYRAFLAEIRDFIEKKSMITSNRRFVRELFFQSLEVGLCGLCWRVPPRHDGLEKVLTNTLPILI